MAQLPSALTCHASRPSRRLLPRDWPAKSLVVVGPPAGRSALSWSSPPRPRPFPTPALPRPPVSSGLPTLCRREGAKEHGLRREVLAVLVAMGEHDRARAIDDELPGELPRVVDHGPLRAPSRPQEDALCAVHVAGLPG